MNGNIRYQLKTPYRDGTTHVIFEPLDFITRLATLAPCSDDLVPEFDMCGLIVNVGHHISDDFAIEGRFDMGVGDDIQIILSTPGHL